MTTTYLEQLSPETPLSLNFFQQEVANLYGIKIYHLGKPLILSDLFPLLENLGFKVISDNPAKLSHQGEDVWLHDFNLKPAFSGQFRFTEVKDKLESALLRSWLGKIENDRFNQLVLLAELDSHQVALLRGYAQYLKQLGFNQDLTFVADTLAKHSSITRLLIDLFNARFQPEVASATQEAKYLEELEKAREEVNHLAEDQLIASYIELIQATLRSNFFQLDEKGKPKATLSYKLNPSKITGIPQPCPKYEIFVSSPKVEGVHLRYGDVARGGLRWSDRLEDYRTEVLGLVKAQQVKNAVIVPVGAKGGFVCTQMPENPSRDEFMAEGIACYQSFIAALLDVTDNLVDGKVVPPANLVRQDGDDPYLVVAADKGTATFSDIANELAAQYNFWLGDAFASGGSQGYDHKKMGITASGGWVNVQRHFRELGVDVQEDTFSVVGLGDMSGDVFGNAMLQSNKILLTAAFNHLHIFVDPNPADPEASFRERQRLFDLPRSSWADYNQQLISEGGGIFERTGKSIKITPQMQERFGISESQLTPNQLISALLKAPVDLIWNGGIGTYVKGANESHADVGDKANDSVRVNGGELRAKVVGEGGNLGFTQLGRTEAAKAGVKINADFIDNAGGVNCSDHEVNIKILLQDVVAQGLLNQEERNQLLEAMTDEVSRLVLRDNYTQSQALSLAALASQENLGPFQHLIQQLEAKGELDRALEFLPTDAELNLLASSKEGLARPELAVLLAYTKADIKNQLLATNLPEDPWLAKEAERALPQILTEKYAKQLSQHRLKNEMLATKLVNQLVDQLGLTLVHQLQASNGYSIAQIVRAYIMQRELLATPSLMQQIEALDNQVSANLQLSLMHQAAGQIAKIMQWLISNKFATEQAQNNLAKLQPEVAQLQANLSQHLTPEEAATWQAAANDLETQGIPADLATQLTSLPYLVKGLNFLALAQTSGQNLARVSQAACLINNQLKFAWLAEKLDGLEVNDQWAARAQQTWQKELTNRQGKLVLNLLKGAAKKEDLNLAITSWQEANQKKLSNWQSLIDQAQAKPETSPYVLAVLVRQLRKLKLK